MSSIRNSVPVVATAEDSASPEDTGVRSVLSAIFWRLQESGARLGLSAALAFEDWWLRFAWRFNQISPPDEDGEPLLREELRDLERWDRLIRWLCMMNGHGSVRWYNPGRFEPDMTCTVCGEDLG